MISAFFWHIMQCIVVISYRRFGTSVPKRKEEITTINCIMCQKNADIIYFAAEARNYAYVYMFIACRAVLYNIIHTLTPPTHIYIYI